MSKLKRPSSVWSSVGLGIACFCLVSHSLSAQSAAGSAATNAPPQQPKALADMDITELANIEVSSVSKKQTRLVDSPAAVAVLTEDDIRRLGATSIPDALRAIPGMQVAQINANTWAISSRGFDDQYSSKLLVLVDGRTVYTPTFSGVNWNVQDLVLEDLDRIEVIRGPGATLWGANAVNGVINIISKSAKETQGALVSTTVGTEAQPSVSARYGGKLSTNLFYRVYVKYANGTEFQDSAGHGMGDGWDMTRGGMRMDWEPSDENTFTLQGDFYNGTFGEQVEKTAALPPTNLFLNVEAPSYGGNILGRWTRRFSESSELKLQAYYDGFTQKDPFGGGAIIFGPGFTQDVTLSERRNTADLDLQHRFTLGDRHELVWGGGFRYTADALESNGSEISFDPAKRDDKVFSAFAQDEITLVQDRLRVMLGSKFEHNDFTGFEVQPGGRLLWTPTDSQSFWAAVSRAVRTPSRVEENVRVNLSSFQLPNGTPAQVSVFGNPDLDSEELLAYEVGYRVEPTPNLSFDVAGFYNDYDLIGTQTNASALELTPGPPHLLFDPYNYTNGIHVHTYGAELLGQWRVTENWRVAASYSWLHTGSTSDTAVLPNPQQLASLRSSLDLGRGLEFNGAVYYEDRIYMLSTTPAPVEIPPYVRLDLGLSWSPGNHWQFSFWAQNLLDAGHSEFASYKTSDVAQIPRTFYGKVTWRF